MQKGKIQKYVIFGKIRYVNIAGMAGEIVKYNNKLNTLTFHNFTESEMKIFFALIAKMKNHGTESVMFTFSELKQLTHEKKNYTKIEYAKLIESMYSKLISLRYKYDDGEDMAGEFNLFTGYNRSLKEEYFELSVTPQFQSLLNDLAREFTRFELEEFIKLRGKYTKQIYRLLKQWRTVGHYSVLIKEFRELVDIPEKYNTGEMTRRVIDPAIEKLHEIYAFRNLKYEYSYAGHKPIRVIFSWNPELVDSAGRASTKYLESEWKKDKNGDDDKLPWM